MTNIIKLYLNCVYVSLFKAIGERIRPAYKATKASARITLSIVIEINGIELNMGYPKVISPLSYFFIKGLKENSFFSVR